MRSGRGVQLEIGIVELLERTGGNITWCGIIFAHGRRLILSKKACEIKRKICLETLSNFRGKCFNSLQKEKAKTDHFFK
jgi:hypothetical protein